MTGIFLYKDNIYEQGFKSRSYFLKQKLIPIDLNLDISVINSKIKEINPDYIFVYYSNDYKKLEDIGKLGIPIVIELSDFWERLFSDNFKEARKKIKFKGISVQCRCAIRPFKDYFNNEDIDMFWFKWGVDTDILKDYNLPKVGEVYFSGKYSSYESRRMIMDILHKEKSIKFYDILPYPKSKINYETYAKNLNRSYIAIGGCLQNNNNMMYKGMFIGNTFMRNLEIPAAGACLFNTPFGDMKALGFRDGVNCIISRTYGDIIGKIKYYLDNKELLAKITKNGYDLVHSKYSSEMVVDEFIKKLEMKYA